MHAFTNIHVAEKNLRESAQSADTTLPRLRKLTNDPAREYAQRAGEAEQLPDSVVALILSKQGYSKVSRNGIRVEGVTEKPLNFWCEHSITIAEKAGTNEKVLWTLNRLKPDVLHILGADGEYIESIPLEGKVPWFDEAATRNIHGSKTRANNRRIDRVRALHAPDSEAAVAAATANEIALKSIVHTFPISPRDRRDSSATPVLPGVPGQERIADASRAGTLSERQQSNLGEVSADGVEENDAETVELPSRAEGLARSSARAAFPEINRQDLQDSKDSGNGSRKNRDNPVQTSFPRAERLQQVERHLDGHRRTHEERVQVRKSAARFGAASLRSESRIDSRLTNAAETAATTTPTEIEEW